MMTTIVMLFMTTESGLEWRAAGVQGTRQQLSSGALAQTKEHIQGDPLLHLHLQHEKMWVLDADNLKSDNNDNNNKQQQQQNTKNKLTGFNVGRVQIQKQSK